MEDKLRDELRLEERNKKRLDKAAKQMKKKVKCDKTLQEMKKHQEEFEDSLTGKKLVDTILQNKMKTFAMLFTLQREGILTRRKIDHILGDDKSRKLYTLIKNKIEEDDESD